MFNTEVLDYYYNAKEVVSENLIVELEEKYQLKLPADYRNFLLEYNGAELNYPIFDLKVNNHSYEVSIWSILGLTENSGLYWANDEYGDEIDDNFVIICHGDGFMVMNHQTEEIYFWDDEYQLPISSEEQNVFKVANSFTEFIKLLHIEE